MNDLQNLSIAQGFYTVIASAVSTKDPDSLRCRMDNQIIANYYETGAKSFDLLLNKVKVGTYSIRFSKAAHYDDLVVKNREQFVEWCCNNGLAKTEQSYTVAAPNDNMTQAEREAYELLVASGIIKEETVVCTENFAIEDAKSLFKKTGEVPGGCVVETIDEEAVPIGTLLKVHPELIAKAMGEDLPGAVIGLLSESGDAR